jgi:hypothetical protein
LSGPVDRYDGADEKGPEEVAEGVELVEDEYAEPENDRALYVKEDGGIGRYCKTG